MIAAATHPPGPRVYPQTGWSSDPRSRPDYVVQSGCNGNVFFSNKTFVETLVFRKLKEGTDQGNW